MDQQEENPSKRTGFLGTPNKDGRPRKNFVPYTDARQWVSRLGLTNYYQWLKFAQMRYKKGPLKGKLIRPTFIPAHPSKTYRLRGDWKNETDFLGNNVYWNYNEANKFVLSLNVKSVSEWHEWYKVNRPVNIPRFPNVVYPEWKLWSDFLGTNRVYFKKKVPYTSFNEAIKLVHSLRLNNVDEYRLWVKQNPQFNLPTFPEGYYKEWDGWIKFLGKSLVDRIEVEQSIDNSVLYIAHHRGTPSNVYEIRIEKQGRVAVEVKRLSQNFSVEKMYLIQPEDVPLVKKIVMLCGTEWWERDHFYAIRNIHELLFQLDVLMFSV